MEELEVAPCSVPYEGGVLRFRGDTLKIPGILQIVTSDWDVLATFIESIFQNFDRFGADSNKSDSLSYISPYPPNEISGFVRTVAEEVLLLRGEGRFESPGIEFLVPPPLLGRNPAKLSGGETARTVLASHILRKSKIVVADHVLGELDGATRSTFLDLFAHGRVTQMLVVAEAEPWNVNSRLWTLSPDSGSVDCTWQWRKSTSRIPQDRGLVVLPGVQREKSRRILEIEGLEVKRGSRRIVLEVSLSLGSGELMWLLGPNGCGKTTLLESILGWIEPISGRCTIHAPESGRGRVRVAYSPQHPDEDVTEKTLAEEAQVGQTRRTLRETGKLLFELGLSSEQMDGMLASSRALRKLASVLRVLVGEEDIALLDEPTLFLGPEQKRSVVAAVKQRLERQGAIMITTHDDEFFEVTTEDTQGFC